MEMSSISQHGQRVRAAAGLPQVLESAWQAFECVMAEAEAHEDPATPLFPAFVLAATAAANGRDAVLLAPSLPWPPPGHPARRGTGRRAGGAGGGGAGAGVAVPGADLPAGGGRRIGGAFR
jgi:hypothetical protein